MAVNFNQLVFGAGFVFYVLAGLLRIGLAGAFVVAILRWNLYPWWSWPIAVVAAVMLSRVGKMLMATSEEAMLRGESSWEAPGGRASTSAMSPAGR